MYQTDPMENVIAVKHSNVFIGYLNWLFADTAVGIDAFWFIWVKKVLIGWLNFCLRSYLVLERVWIFNQEDQGLR